MKEVDATTRKMVSDNSRQKSASNGAVENAVVKSLKRSIYNAMNDSLNTTINRYLLTYRITPYSETRESPAKLMFGRKLKTYLDLLYSDNLNNIE